MPITMGQPIITKQTMHEYGTDIHSYFRWVVTNTMVQHNRIARANQSEYTSYLMMQDQFGKNVRNVLGFGLEDEVFDHPKYAERYFTDRLFVTLASYGGWNVGSTDRSKDRFSNMMADLLDVQQNHEPPFWEYKFSQVRNRYRISSVDVPPLGSTFLNILNYDQVSTFLKQAQEKGLSLEAVKGDAPANAVYHDGVKIQQPVNVAWQIKATNERVNIYYEQ